MPKLHRHRALAALALVSTVVTGVLVGCATSVDTDTEDGAPDASADATKRDARGADATDIPVDGSGGEDDAAVTTDSGAKLDAAAKDAATDAAKADAGTDAGAEAGVDASPDASPDAGSASRPAQGDVVISEVMFNPSGADEVEREWFEIHNTTATPKLLSGLTIKDGGGRTHTIRGGVVVAPGAYVVLASMQAAAVAGGKVPAAAIVYDYNTGVAGNGIQLANGNTGGVVLLDGATEIARAAYGPLGLSGANEASVQLKTPTFAAAGTKASWCVSPTAWTAGADRGTPGAASDCP